MRAVVLAASLRLHVDCIPARSLQTPCFRPDFILSVLFCTLLMPVPCLLPRAAHPARCTPLRYVLFPVLWFLRFVYDLFSCVVCIVRAEPFYPLCIPCVLFVLMCCAPLCIPVSCLFLCYMCVLCFDPCALSVPSFYTWHSFVRYVLRVIHLVQCVCALSLLVCCSILCAVLGLFPCVPVFRILRVLDYTL